VRQQADQLAANLDGVTADELIEEARRLMGLHGRR
jgi:hypothetical protein